MAHLDESALAGVLAFISEPSARLCCRSWSQHLHESLQLQHRVRFHKHVRSCGGASYHHCAVRAMGQDFEECVAYRFEFSPSGTYSLAWTRTFDQWSADNERQVGVWRVVGDKVHCESTEGPPLEDGCVRFARAGLAFQLPIGAILEGQTMADDVTEEWELAARGRQQEAPQHSSHQDFGDWPDTSHSPAVALQDPDVRYMEVDGQVYEVSRDIRDNWPESEWERLMICRVRFGIRGQA